MGIFMDELKERLKYEFDAKDKSFLIKLRIELTWDHQHFIEILKLFYKFNLNNENEVLLERDISDGFWYYANFVKNWTSHEDFRYANKLSNDYFELAYELIYLSADWYFTGMSPYIEHVMFLDEIDNLSSLVF